MKRQKIYFWKQPATTIISAIFNKFIVMTLMDYGGSAGLTENFIVRPRKLRHNRVTTKLCSLKIKKVSFTLLHFFKCNFVVHMARLKYYEELRAKIFAAQRPQTFSVCSPYLMQFSRSQEFTLGPVMQSHLWRKWYYISFLEGWEWRAGNGRVSRVFTHPVLWRP